VPTFLASQPILHTLDLLAKFSTLTINVISGDMRAAKFHLTSPPGLLFTKDHMPVSVRKFCLCKFLHA